MPGKSNSILPPRLCAILCQGQATKNKDFVQATELNRWHGTDTERHVGRKGHQGRQSTEKESNEYPRESRPRKGDRTMGAMRLQNGTLPKEAVCDLLGSLHAA